jgi:hypothetical protein
MLCSELEYHGDRADPGVHQIGGAQFVHSYATPPSIESALEVHVDAGQSVPLEARSQTQRLALTALQFP